MEEQPDLLRQAQAFRDQAKQIRKDAREISLKNDSSRYEEIGLMYMDADTREGFAAMCEYEFSVTGGPPRDFVGYSISRE